MAVRTRAKMAARLSRLDRGDKSEVAVGSWGDGLLSPDEVAKAIKEYQSTVPDRAGRDRVGM
jgi:hypothetical protein